MVFFVVFQTGDDDHMLSTTGQMIVVHIVFYGVGLIYTLIDVTNKPKFLMKYKIQPGTNEPVDQTKLKRLIL